MEKEEIENEKKAKCDAAGCIKKMNKFVIAICIIMCAIVIGLVITVFAINNQTSSTISKKAGNTMGNIRNYGYAAKGGKYIYYLAPNENSSKVGIYKIRKDGKGEIKNIYMTESDIVSINYYDNKVYFIEVSTDSPNPDDELNNKIVRMDTNGENVEVINDNNFNNNCYEMYVIDGSVYFIGLAGEIAKMDLDGNNIQTVINTKYGYLGVNEDYIIYKILENDTDEDYVTYIANLDGTNQRPVLDKQRLYSVNIEGDYIYYTNANKEICRTKIDSKEEELYYSTEAYNLNVNNGFGYYLNYFDPENNDYTVCIYKIALNQKNPKPELIQKMETYSTFLDVVGKWAIYMDSDEKSGFINMVNVKGTGEAVSLYKLDYEEYYNGITNDEDDYSDVSVDGVVPEVPTVENVTNEVVENAVTNGTVENTVAETPAEVSNEISNVVSNTTVAENTNTVENTIENTVENVVANTVQ